MLVKSWQRRLAFYGIGLCLGGFLIAVLIQPSIAISRSAFTHPPAAPADLTAQVEGLTPFPPAEAENPPSEDNSSPIDSVPTIIEAGPEFSEVEAKEALTLWQTVRDRVQNFVRTSWKRWLVALLATGVLALLIWLLGLVFPQIDKHVQRMGDRYIRPLKLQNLEILSTQQISGFLQAFFSLLQGPIVIGLIAIYGLTILRIFPITTKISIVLSGYILQIVFLAWSSFLNYLPNIVYIAIVILLLRFFNRCSRFIFKNIEQDNISFPGFYREWAKPTQQIIRFIAFIFALAVIFPLLPGSSSPAFQGISIVVGLLVSLGSTAAVANIMAGLALTYTRAFRVGDRVSIGDITGDVLEKSIMVTRLKTAKKENITIPNSTVLDSKITNFSASVAKGGLILHVSISIGYEVPWEKIHELMLAAAAMTENVLTDPAPFVLQTKLDDFYVVYELNAHTNIPKLIPITYSKLYQNLLVTFREGEVDITSPHYSFLVGGGMPPSDN